MNIFFRSYGGTVNIFIIIFLLEMRVQQGRCSGHDVGNGSNANDKWAGKTLS